MRYMISLLSFLFSATVLFAQEGINFDHGSWSEVLTKAKQENKLVFVDVYTSWCGPCKKMVAEVFPKKEVGDLFNASFVNYKIDAEKGEGIKLAKFFDVKAFPTYLFVNGDGELVYRLTGYNEPALFLQQANIALKEKNDPRPFVKWENEYASGKRDKEFLLGYLEKRAVLKISSADILEEVFPLLTDADWNNKEIVNSLFFYDVNSEYVPGANVFKYIIGNYKTVDSLLGKSSMYSLRLLQLGLRNYFKKNIVANNREDMLAVMLKASQQLSQMLKEKYIDVSLKRFVMDYYDGTANEAKLIPAAVDYVENGLLKMNIDSIRSEDAIAYQKFLEPYRNGKSDSTKNENWYVSSRVMRNNKMVNSSYNLRDAAEAIFNHSENKKVLAKAVEWARLANEWFPHFSNETVYAALLYKTGKKQAAAEHMKKANEDPILKGQADIQRTIADNIDKMKRNESLKNLWKKSA